MYVQRNIKVNSRNNFYRGKQEVVNTLSVCVCVYSSLSYPACKLHISEPCYIVTCRLSDFT